MRPTTPDAESVWVEKKESKCVETEAGLWNVLLAIRCVKWEVECLVLIMSSQDIHYLQEHSQQCSVDTCSALPCFWNEHLCEIELAGVLVFTGHNTVAIPWDVKQHFNASQHVGSVLACLRTPFLKSLAIPEKMTFRSTGITAKQLKWSCDKTPMHIHP